MPVSSDITDFTIFLIDDDPCMLKALVTLLQTDASPPPPLFFFFFLFFSGEAMSAFGTKRTWQGRKQCPLSGVKRTSQSFGSHVCF